MNETGKAEQRDGERRRAGRPGTASAPPLRRPRQGEPQGAN